MVFEKKTLLWKTKKLKNPGGFSGFFGWVFYGFQYLRRIVGEEVVLWTPKHPDPDGDQGGAPDPYRKLAL